MWWNVTGLAVAAAVTVLGSRLLAPPAPAQLVGTTLSVAALRSACSEQRVAVASLLAWALLCVAMAAWLGVR